MKRSLFVAVGASLIAAGNLLAQSPDFAGGRGRRGGGDVVAASVTRMMSFDADGDGKLAKSEVTDPRLVSLFDRADADKDGTVTKDELTALFTREASARFGGPGEGPPGRPGGRSGGPPRDGNPPDAGPTGESRDGFAPPPGPPRPGEVLPRFLQDELQLTSRQRDQLEKLQSDVDERLAKILTEKQFAQLAEMRQRGPGRRPADGPPPGEPRSGRRQRRGRPPADTNTPPPDTNRDASTGR